MLLQIILTQLDNLAPNIYQENYDNAGLIVGNVQQEIAGILIGLDCTEAVLAEAIATGCNLIVCHHPIVFSGIKKLNGNNYVERVVIKAIQNNIAIYASHTNLDNMVNGVNAKMAEKIGLVNCKILAPQKSTLKKLYIYAPAKAIENIKQALFAIGAGNIANYSQCSFATNGNGTFLPNQNANPKVGEIGTQEKTEEIKLEIIFQKHIEAQIINCIQNFTFYEEVAYEIISIDNANLQIGAGLIGELPSAIEENIFLQNLKTQFNAQCIRHTILLNKKIKKVALCGGAGSFLLPNAIKVQADIYISADFKYHEFFDAENKIVIADIGHYESEQYTSEIFYATLQEKFPNFAIRLSKVNTNPINYL